MEKSIFKRYDKVKQEMIDLEKQINEIVDEWFDKNVRKTHRKWQLNTWYYFPEDDTVEIVYDICDSNSNEQGSIPTLKGWDNMNVKASEILNIK